MQRSITPSRHAQSQSAMAREQDALSLLKADHDHVHSLFDDFEALGEQDLGAKQELAQEICHELLLHTAAEEEIFYPAVRDIRLGEDLVDEAVVEHASAKQLIEQILEMAPQDTLFDAKMKVLREQIEHHVQEEEQDMFPRASQSGLDLIDLGSKIAQRKAEGLSRLAH